MSWFWDFFLGCEHRWTWFTGPGSEMTFYNNDKGSFVATVALCKKCKEVRWKYVRDDL